MDIYHYCSWEAFNGIIFSKAIWLTSVMSMDDVTEIDFLYDEILQIAKKCVSYNFPDESLENIHQYYNFLENQVLPPIRPKPFCACFSNNSNSDYQWENYANKGEGICLEFDSDFFNIPNTFAYPNTNIYNSIGFFNVLYNPIYQINELYKILFDPLDKYINDQYNFSSTESIEQLKGLISLSPLFKSGKYSNEQEVRIIYFYYQTHKKYLDSGNFISGPFCHENNKGMFCRFDLRWYINQTTHAIKKIIIGQKSKKNKKEIIELLQKNSIYLPEDQII